MSSMLFCFHFCNF